MEVINNYVAIVYHRVNVDEDDKTMIKENAKTDIGQLVKWKVKYRINRYPTSLQEYTSVPYLFSPNFTY